MKNTLSLHRDFRKQLPGKRSPERERKLSRTQVIGRLAQLVQSICLTSRGSAVQIRQRPPFSSSTYRFISVGAFSLGTARELLLPSRGSKRHYSTKNDTSPLP